MQKYSGSFNSRVGSVVMALLFLLFASGGVGWVIVDKRSHYVGPPLFLPNTILAALFFLLFGGFGIFSLLYILETLTEYEVGPEGITRRSKFKEASMRWRDVVRMEGGNTSQSTLTLADASGTKLSVEFSCVSDTDGRLRATILENLAPLRARQSAEFAGKEQVLRTAAWARWFLLCFGLLGIVGGAALFKFLPGADLTTRVVAGGTSGILGLLLAVVALYSFSWQLTFSRQELVLSTFFFTRRIPVHRIESVYVFETKQKDQTFQFLKISGDGARITVPSQTPGYPLFRETLLQLVPAEAVLRGEGERAALLEKQKRHVKVILTVCCVMIAGIIGLLGWGTHRKMAFIDSLAKHGVTTMATITGRDCDCSRDRIADAEYRFTVGGKIYTGENDVKAYHNVRLSVHQQTVVRYLPENPSKNRLEICMDWRPPVRNLLLPLGIQLLLIVPLVGYSFARMAYQKRKSAKAALQTDPNAHKGENDDTLVR